MSNMEPMSFAISETEGVRKDSSVVTKVQDSHHQQPPSFKTDALLSFAQAQASLANDRGLKRNKNVQELTINKLKYDSVGLVGRDEELQQLRESIVRTSENGDNAKKELVFVKGYSGCGKSTLIERVQKLAKGHVVFAKGKYDQNNRDVPYSGLASAFGEVCGLSRVKFTGKQLDSIGDELISELGSEISLLQQIVPGIDEILPSNHRRLSDIIDPSNFGAMQERLKYSFRVLARTLSSHCSPLVLVLDDIHWADVGSLKMLGYLMTDTQNPSPLVILATYRSNEVDNAHLLISVINDLRRSQESCNLRVSNIELDNLGLDDVHKVVISLLDMDADLHTSKLAELCFKRTHGNPYFLLQFIAMLEEEDMLSFNLGTFKWSFNVELVEEQTMATANVVDLLQHRMGKLDASIHLLLQYAACLGATFSVEILQIVWSSHSANQQQHVSVLEMLAVIEGEKLIEQHDLYSYRWVHDKVQEAALSLGKASQQYFQYEIGKVLVEKLGSQALDTYLFTVIDLINYGSRNEQLVSDELKHYAALNLRSAKKARSVSAFEAGANYVRNGISLLEAESPWALCREIILELYTIGAEIELALGHIDAMEKYSEKVLSNQECKTMEKFPLYLAKLFKLSTIDQNRSETHRFSLSVLKELMGYRLVTMPATVPLRAILALRAVIKIAKSKTRKEYKLLPKMTNPRHEATMKAMHRYLTNCFLSRRKFLFVLAAVHMIKMTLQHGLSEYAGTAFAILGQMTVRSDPKTAAYFGEVALLLQQRVRSRFTESNTLFFVVAFIFPWTKELHHCMAHSTPAIMSGLQSGNLEHASWSLLCFNNQLPYQMGKPIASILNRCEVDVAQIKEMKQQEQIVVYRLHHQLLLNLAGLSESTIKLKGAAFNCDSFVMKTPLQRIVHDILQLDLALFFGELESAADLALNIAGNFRRTSPNYFVEMFETFHCAIALYGMARRSKNKRKYRNTAVKLQKRITRWLVRGNPNVQHYVLFLQAEKSALDGNCDSANKSFQDSIRLAARTGHIHHAALFNERYADFLRHTMIDEENAKFRMEEAIRFYGEWGAEGVVRALSSPLSL